MSAPSAAARWSPQALARFGVRALRITASSVALVELLRQQWLAGALFGLAWLLVVQGERRLPQEPPAPSPLSPGGGG